VLYTDIQSVNKLKQIHVKYNQDIVGGFVGICIFLVFSRRCYNYIFNFFTSEPEDGFK